MKISVSPEVSRVIAERAQVLVREYAVREGWSHPEALEAVWGEGFAGLRTTRHYLMFLEKGTQPYLMHSLEGRTIRFPDGSFRRVKGVGLPGFVTLPGGVRTWRYQKWRHPGIRPRKFMDQTIQQAVLENQGLIKGYILSALKGGV